MDGASILIFLDILVVFDHIWASLDMGASNLLQDIEDLMVPPNIWIRWVDELCCYWYGFSNKWGYWLF